MMQISHLDSTYVTNLSDTRNSKSDKNIKLNCSSWCTCRLILKSKKKILIER